jgi:hypothetical protein
MNNISVKALRHSRHPRHIRHIRHIFLGVVVGAGVFFSLGNQDCLAGGVQGIGGRSNHENLSDSVLVSPSVGYFGIIPKVVQMDDPWQLINPCAARSYGYGRDMTSWSKLQGKPKGFIVFGVRFW